MRKNYEQFSAEELILRDHLAADRTILACERTLLAYIRTALTSAIAGMTLIKFFDGIYYQITGVALLVLSLIIAVLSYLHFRRERIRLSKFFN